MAVGNNIYIAEFATLPVSLNAGQMSVGSLPALVLQTPLATATTASAQSSAFSNQTNFIRVHTDATGTGTVASVFVLVGANPTATTNHMRMASNQTEYFAVFPGQKLAAIAAA